jgi:hypothetical protein
MPDHRTNARRLEEIEKKYQMIAVRLKNCSNRTQPFASRAPENDSDSRGRHVIDASYVAPFLPRYSAGCSLASAANDLRKIERCISQSTPLQNFSPAFLGWGKPDMTKNSQSCRSSSGHMPGFMLHVVLRFTCASRCDCACADESFSAEGSTLLYERTESHLCTAAALEP